MSLTVFDRLIDELPDSVNRIFFGGIGEPLCHPDILYMLHRAKAAGRTVEMITNGTLLDREMSEKIIDTGLDLLWISLDSMEDDSYESIRKGASFEVVKNGMRIFNRLRRSAYWVPSQGELPIEARPRLGIAFVLMKSNLSQYKALLSKAYGLGIDEVKATHLIPYDESQIEETCYKRMFERKLYEPSKWTSVNVNMPFMDTEDISEWGLLPAFSDYTLSFSFMDAALHRKTRYCRFVSEGVVFVRWDAEVCPCMALLHNNTVYQHNRRRRVLSCSFGSLNDASLAEVWGSNDYSSFRKKVLDFEFSPCSHCATCDLYDTNEEDCIGNTFPTCGACLWAQGIIQCP